MKKRSTAQESRKGSKPGSQGPITIGIDLGDKSSCYCVLDGAGEVARQGRFATTNQGLSACFGAMPRCVVALEVGTHSAWVSR